jgi:uncharacterized protein YqeY
MSTPQARLEADLKDAMKARAKERLSTLRMLLTEVKNERIERGADLDDDAFAAVVRRAIKQRHESERQYRDGGRPELADKEKREAEILAGYLPEQVGEAEIRAAVAEFVAAEGLSGARGLGPVMKAMIQRFGATADGGTINRIAREVLGA